MFGFPLQRRPNRRPDRSGTRGDLGGPFPPRAGGPGYGPWSLLLLVSSCLGAAFFPNPLSAQEGIDPGREYNVKAVYLYSFGRYVTWPAASFERTLGDFVIGVLGESPISSPLRTIAAKKTIGGRRIVIRQFPSPDAVDVCQILFVPRTANMQRAGVVADRLRSSGILLIGEQAGFASSDGMIEFFTDGLTVRFRINVGNIREQQLGIDAKLLRLGLPVAPRR